MLFADEQWAEEQRRRTNAGRRREQPVGEQLLMGDDNDEGVDVAAEDHFVVEGADDEDGDDDEGVDVAAIVPAVAGEVEEEDVHVGGEDDLEDNDEGYDSFIEERSRPATPQPDPAVERDADGWNLIAKLGPTASFLSSFPALQEVPCQHEQTWVEAFSKVLRRWWEAATEVEIIIALSWLLFLPQALLRRPSRGGSRQERGGKKIQLLDKRRLGNCC